MEGKTAPLLVIDWTSSGRPTGHLLDVYWTYTGSLLGHDWISTGPRLGLDLAITC